MSCENLLIVNHGNENLNVIEFLLRIYERDDISILCQDCSSYKFKTNIIPPKPRFIEESLRNPNTNFIVSFFYVKDSHYTIGYFAVQNGKTQQEKIWDSEKRDENGLSFAVKFVSRFYPLLMKDIFVN